jgi:hypothetical protein
MEPGREGGGTKSENLESRKSMGVLSDRRYVSVLKRSELHLKRSEISLFPHRGGIWPSTGPLAALTSVEF